MDERMEMVYTNSRGESLSIKDSAPFVFLSQVGLDGTDVTQLMTKAPHQIGKTNTGFVINERVITIKFALLSDDEDDQRAKRRNLIRVFNPTMTGNLRVIWGDLDLTCDCLVQTTPKFADEDYTQFESILEGQVILVTPEGLLRDTTETVKDIVSGASVICDNSGDIEAPLIAEIFGPFTSFSLQNATTGGIIKLNKSIAQGDKIVIDTSDANRKIELVTASGQRSNAFGSISYDSSIFNLSGGANNIKFTAVGGSSSTGAKIRFNRRWIGL